MRFHVWRVSRASIEPADVPCRRAAVLRRCGTPDRLFVALAATRASPCVRACAAAMGKKDKETKEENTLTRIAIVNAEKCKPSKCMLECKKSCPVVRMGKFCIEVQKKDKIAWISEELCIGCNICTKVPARGRPTRGTRPRAAKDGLTFSLASARRRSAPLRRSRSSTCPRTSTPT